MERWSGKTAVVTGAASGIGASIAASLLRHGINVVGLDVQIERLRKQTDEHQKSRDDEQHGNMYAVECDVSSEDDVLRAFDWIEENVGPLHVMVNNAGVTDYTPVIDSDRESLERVININLLGMASCVGKAVRSMRKHDVKEGHIFNINSVLGHELPEGIPSEESGANGWSLYPASKHASLAMTHTVRREISRLSAPIRITSISPGIVRTEITKHNEVMRDLLDKVTALDPSDIAGALLYALSTRPEVQITEITVRSTGEPL